MSRLFVIFSLFLLVLSSNAYAHEMVPTYLKWKPSYVDGLYVTTMKMFNKRKEIEYYEVGVFDSNFNSVPFATSSKIIKVNYLGHVTFELYVKKEDVDRAIYVCSISKIRKSNEIRTAVTSKICSKYKKE